MLLIGILEKFISNSICEFWAEESIKIFEDIV